ncbi:MAG TPA: TIGR03943 family protein [Anaerolineaceae bacterium]
MTEKAYRTLQALTIGLFGFFLLVKVWDGRVLLYINQRFIILVLGAALFMLLLSQVVFGERERLNSIKGKDHHGIFRLWVIALPLILGLVIPERPLGATALPNRGINTSSGLSIAQVDTFKVLDISPEQRSILDWIRIFSSSTDSQLYLDQKVDVTGFVYHAPNQPEDEFYVSRFAITCCVADASAVGIVVSWKEAAALPSNRWVRVRGIMRALRANNQVAPKIEATLVEFVPEPEQPYLFP